jgi:hypothetical protein
LCISICGKDKPFPTSLLVKFSLEKIIYPICEETKPSISGHTCSKVSGSNHSPHHLQEEL